MKNFLLTAIAILGFSAVSFAQPLTANATATGKLVAAISIAKQGTDMSFGNVIAGTAGTVVLVPAGTRTSAALALPGGTVSAAQFRITGQTGSVYKITLPSTVQVTKGLEHMDVTGFNHNATLTLASTSEDFSVGATLNVLGTETVGTYTSANFDVTVSYE